MQESANTAKPDRWWIVAASVALVGVGLAALLWNYPTSKWVWALASGIVIFAVVAYHNPRHRLWRRANACFGTAGALAFVPTVVARAQLEEIGAFEFVSESSSLVVLGFLAAGLFLAWLDSPKGAKTPPTQGVASTNTNLSSVNSHNAIAGLTAGGDIIINQGLSEDTILAAGDLRLIATKIQGASPVSTHQVDEDLVWRLVDDIKAARRKLEREEVSRLLSDLRKSFERSGDAWPKVLRVETLLLMAEEERTRVSQERAQGRQVDITRLQELLKELRDAGT